jgi:non-heme chloroperoxidase
MRIACDAWGDPSDRPVILLHGGGQTRHAWGGTACALAASGMYALALDLRGHGDSDWCAKGNYLPEAFVADLHAIMQTLDEPAAIVGASLGGQAGLLCQGELHPNTASALVLVDVTPRLESKGVERIVKFMQARPDGFASIDEAADAVAEFLPHRPRPLETAGLEKNLRCGADGRWRWHWDPRFLMRAADKQPLRANEWPARLMRAARALTVPTLLVRGMRSDVVSPEGVQEFLAAVPHAEYVDVEHATHMVAGDSNDVFSESVIGFLSRALARRGSTAA